MAKNYKYSFKLYSSWNYENELEDLNKYSERGWQLVKDGMFHRKFVKNENIRYRYQMDFRRIEDKGRYIETFREQGWEYVDSNFNVCHFFRKIYDPSLPEEEYEIFTDRESLHEMNNRWARIAFVACIFFGIMALLPGIKMIKTPSVFLLLNFITNMVVFIVLLRGFLIMRNPESKKNRRGDSIFITVFLAAVILGASGSIFLMTSRTEGFPLVLVEAATCGLPIVAFDCPCGPRNVLDGNSGLLIPYEDDDAYVAAVQQLMSNIALRQKMGEDSKRDIVRFSQESVMQRWLHLFSSDNSAYEQPEERL